MNILSILTHITMNKIINTIFIILCGYVAIKISQYFVRKLEHKWNLDVTLIYITNDLIKYIVILITIGCILSVFGINLQGIIVSLGVIGVILGIASKDIVSNFLSGIFVLSDKTIRVGDIMEVSDYKGTVQKIGFRNTTIINQNNQIITIPNSLLNSKPYRKFLDLEDYRIDISVILPPNADLKEFEKDMKKTIPQYEWVNNTTTITIKGDSITEEGPKIIVSTWIKSYEMLDPGKLIIMDEINKYIHKNYS